MKNQNEIFPHNLTKSEIMSYQLKYSGNVNSLVADMKRIDPGSRLYFLNSILGLNKNPKFDPALCKRIIVNEKNLSLLEAFFPEKIFLLIQEKMPDIFFSKSKMEVEEKSVTSNFIADRYNPSALPACENFFFPVYLKSWDAKILAEGLKSPAGQSSNCTSLPEDTLIRDCQDFNKPCHENSMFIQNRFCETVAIANNLPPQSLTDSGITDPSFPKMMVDSVELGQATPEGLINSGSTLLKDLEARQQEKSFDPTESAEYFVNQFQF